ncbi:MAG: AMP-binding protein [Candidatus Rokuibacteriota bacterium]
MADPSPVPAWQQAIRDRCVHPTGRFVAFPPEDVEGTLPARFARQARTHADRLAVRSDRHELTDRDLSRAATSVARFLRRRRGAGPGVVAVLCEPGAPAVWSALGAMAAGTMFDVDVPVRALLESPTVARMAAVVIDRRVEIELARQAADERGAGMPPGRTPSGRG